MTDYHGRHHRHDDDYEYDDDDDDADDDADDDDDDDHHHHHHHHELEAMIYGSRDKMERDDIVKVSGRGSQGVPGMNRS